MANTTPNYNLIKPLGTEKYDVAVPNANMDNIDLQLKNLEDTKVDAETGKGLSEENYTLIEKDKVANLPDDTNAQLAETDQEIMSFKEDYATLETNLSEVIQKKKLINLIKNGNFVDTSIWVNNATMNFSALNNEAILTSTSYSYITQGSTVANHKYYFKADIKTSDTNVRLFVPYGGNKYAISDGIYHRISFISIPTTSSPTMGFNIEITGVGTASVKNVLLIDLTETFGVGNEPSIAQIEEILNTHKILWFDGEVVYTELQNIGIRKAATKIISASDSTQSAKNSSDYTCTGANDEIVIQQAINSLPSMGGKIIMLEGNYYKGNASGISLPSNIDIEIIAGATLKLIDGINADACFFTNSDKVNGNSNINIYGGGRIDCNFRKQLDTTYQCVADFDLVSNSELNIYVTNYTLLEVKAKRSNITINNKKFTQKPYILAPCENISEFTISAGMATTEIDGGFTGSNCIKVTANTNTVIDKVLPTQVNDNFDAYEVGMYVKIDNPTLITNFVIGADSGSSADNLPIKMSNIDILKYFTADKWAYIKAPLNRYILSGKPTFRIAITSSSQANIYIDKIELIPVTSKPQLTWIWDDALKTVPSALRIMSKYGHRGAIAQMGEANIGLNTFMTLEELDMASTEYGWDICVHTSTHMEETVPIGTAIGEFIANKKFIEKNGWKGSQYLVFAGHDTRGEITSAVKKIFNDFRNPLQTISVVRGKYSNFAYQITNFTGLSGEAKSIIRRHLWLSPYSHGLDGSQVTSEALTNWCQFWYDWGLISVPPSEVIGEYNPRYDIV